MKISKKKLSWNFQMLETCSIIIIKNKKKTYNFKTKKYQKIGQKVKKKVYL